MSRPKAANLVLLREQLSEMPETLARYELSSKVCFSSCPEWTTYTTLGDVRLSNHKILVNVKILFP